jgi:hypothetical protein
VGCGSRSGVSLRWRYDQGDARDRRLRLRARDDRRAQGALEALRARGVDVEVLPTAEAVRRYAQLDPRKTAAALHLTC